MTSSPTNPAVDFYFRKATAWRKEQETLRAIMLECPVTEELKWGCPCYTVDGRNVAIIHAFKDYCAVLIVKGALLKDPKGVLIQQTKNVQAGRQIRFTNLREVVGRKAVIKSYIREAIALEKAGVKVPLKPTAEFAVPEEFQKRLDATPALAEAFHALTPGRQRAYLLYLSTAKQSKTREARIDKCAPQIMKGKGLND